MLRIIKNIGKHNLRYFRMTSRIEIILHLLVITGLNDLLSGAKYVFKVRETDSMQPLHDSRAHRHKPV